MILLNEFKFIKKRLRNLAILCVLIFTPAIAQGESIKDGYCTNGVRFSLNIDFIIAANENTQQQLPIEELTDFIEVCQEFEDDDTITANLLIARVFTFPDETSAREFRKLEELAKTNDLAALYLADYFLYVGIEIQRIPRLLDGIDKAEYPLADLIQVHYNQISRRLKSEIPYQRADVKMLVSALEKKEYRACYLLIPAIEHYFFSEITDEILFQSTKIAVDKAIADGANVCFVTGSQLCHSRLKSNRKKGLGFEKLNCELYLDEGAARGDLSAKFRLEITNIMGKK